ncbi:MAG: hypothetical protein NZL93_01255, partial [Chthoniobacterales bacterium]|nr:hypothetical protein [Chthoniobacterales bacterium]
MRSYLVRVIGALQGVEGFLRRWGGLVLLVFAVVYYALYWDAAIWTTGEGGSNVIIAQRMNEGWRPFKDMFIGYNVLWFLPLSWIYKVAGVNFALTQVFFFGLAVVTAWFGWRLVRELTPWAWLAALAAGFMVLMPGKPFRNWMGFVAVISAYAIVKALVVDYPKWWQRVFWMGFAGGVLSLCFLIRVEPMLIVSAVFLGAVAIFLIFGEGWPRERVLSLGMGGAAFVGMFFLVHWPFLVAADKGGYGQEFRDQYRLGLQMILWELREEVKKWTKGTGKVGGGGEVVCLGSFLGDSEGLMASLKEASYFGNRLILQAEDLPSAERYRSERRKLPPLGEVFRWQGAKFFTLALYFPLVSVGVLVFFGCVGFLKGVFCSEGELRRSSFGLLVTTGCSLSLFPQYFFFRPDSVHLAEFLVPYYGACAAGIWVAFSLGKGRGANLWSFLAIIVLVMQYVVAFNGLYGREGSGSIRLARRRTEEFRGENGVRVRLTK